MPNDNQRLHSPAIGSFSQWGPSSKSAHHLRHAGGPKHYVPIPATGVLPAPPIRAQIPPTNGVQPLFVPGGPVSPAMPFSTPVPIPPSSTGWAAAPSRHPAPRLPVPGTGVFLPPGSGNTSSPQHASTLATESSFTVNTSAPTEKENGSGKSSHSSPKGKVDGNSKKQDSSEGVDETLGMKSNS